MGKKILLIIGVIILVIGVIILSYISFQYFGNKDAIVSTLEIVVDDQGNKVNLDKQVPTKDEETDDITPYNFSVKNSGSTDIKYELLIEDFVDDKNSTKKILSRKNLRYELSLNGKVVKKDNLSNVENNIIDVRTVPAKSRNRYELKVWITGKLDSSDWMDKYYNYNIAVNPITR